MDTSQSINIDTWLLLKKTEHIRYNKTTTLKCRIPWHMYAGYLFMDTQKKQSCIYMACFSRCARKIYHKRDIPEYEYFRQGL